MGGADGACAPSSCAVAGTAASAAAEAAALASATAAAAAAVAVADSSLATRMGKSSTAAGKRRQAGIQACRQRLPR